jgi:long-chain acyl-CoA synthetase
MDITPYLDDQKIAPKVVFDSLEERGSRVRFMLPTGDGDWRGMTWKAYADQIRRCGLFLMDEGLAPGDHAAVFAPNSVEWASAALAIQGAGGVMVPIYPSSTADQAAYVVQHSDARYVFVDTAELLRDVFLRWPAYEDVEKIVLLSAASDPNEVDVEQVFDSLSTEAELNGDAEVLPDWADVDRRVVGWDKVMEVGRALEEAKPQSFDERMNSVSMDQPGLMLYTSGTTGKPKGVPLTHQNVVSNGRDWIEVLGSKIPENAVDLWWLPLSHVFGFGEVCLGNILGFTTYMSDPYTVLDKLPEVRPHVFMSIPRYWEKLAQAAIGDDGREVTPEKQRQRLAEITGGNLEFCLSGGAGLKREIKEFFKANDLLIIEGYGLTEASPTLTMNRPDDHRFDSVGKPMPSVDIELADDGEILARGPNIFGGYYKNADATQETFTDDGWLKTGDLGEWTDDGFLKIVGRKKEILVTAGGKNISPAHIEEQFKDDPFIEHVVVYGDGKKYLTGGVWPNIQTVTTWLADHEIADDQREEAIEGLIAERVQAGNDRLPRYETLKAHAIIDTPLTVENGLLTATMKIKRKKVYEAFGDKLEELYR